jgi:Asp-tRNA(Asn)/Glu-tRNA(Gln) amidotransferase A subunit family amidase
MPSIDLSYAIFVCSARYFIPGDPYLSIRETSEDIRSWMATPTELVEEALERIELLDGEIKAFITVLCKQALAEAEQRTWFYRRPLHDIPNKLSR